MTDPSSTQRAPHQRTLTAPGITLIELRCTRCDQWTHLTFPTLRGPICQGCIRMYGPRAFKP